MAFRIKRNRIQLVRGDTFRSKLTILDEDGNEYKPSSDDNIWFTVKRNAASNKALISVEVVGGIVYLRPSDTEGLQYGTYVYDVQITMANGDKDTIIKANIFELLPEVTEQ